MTRTTAIRLLPVACTLLLLSPGCWRSGPKLVPVSGTVTIDGQLLHNGFVRVVPDTGRTCGGKIGPDGRFTLGYLKDNDGCVLGTHKVEIQAFEDLSPTARKWLVPRKYINVATSGLTVSVDGPTNDLKLDLTWAGSGQKGPFIEQMADEVRGGTSLSKRKK
jgi:hypothetical protein